LLPETLATAQAQRARLAELAAPAEEVDPALEAEVLRAGESD
jgi:hypothetical protein